jgi:hypothetical protein
LYDRTISTDETSDEMANNSDTEDDDARKSAEKSRQANGANPIKICESFINREANLVFFINQRPCNSGAQMLEENNKIPKLEDTIVGQAKLTKSSNGYLIALIINDNVSLLAQVETLKKALRSLFDISIELGNLKTISIGVM